jgi:hypothetical protein
MTTYKHLLDVELQGLYDELTDEQKLTLCLRDLKVATIKWVAYRLGIDLDDLAQSFQDEYNTLIEEVDFYCPSLLTDEEIKEQAEEVIEECVCWVNWFSYCDTKDITNYLNRPATV